MRVSQEVGLAGTILALLVLHPFNLDGKDKVSINLMAGANYSLFGDINSAVKGNLNYWRDQVILIGGSYVNRTNSLHISPIYSVDFVYDITSEYSVGIGTGYIRAHNRSEMTLRWPLEPETTASALPDVRAILIRFSIFRFIPINRRMKILFSTGLDTYFGQYRSTDKPGGVGNVNHQKATAIGLGVRYGVGLDIKLAQSLSFVLEGQGHYAQMRGFRGTLYSGGSTLPYEEKGTLYYWEYRGGPGNLTLYPTVLIRETTPSGDVYANVRKARVDFSGFAIMAGIKLSL